MDAVPVLTEDVPDASGRYRQEWYCEPPPPGARFTVVRDEWDAGYSVRKILEVKVR